MSLVRASEVIAPARTSVPRDGYDRPLVVPKGGGKPIALTRTTTFIDCIEDKSALSTWKMRQTLVGAGCKPSLAEQTKLYLEGTPEHKRKLNALAEEAFALSGANDKREKGTSLHELSEEVEAGRKVDASDEDMMDLAAYTMARMDFMPQLTEQFVVCSELAVGGTPDRVDLYLGDRKSPTGQDMLGELLITDLKTGTVEFGALKMAAQLAIYAHAELYDFSLFPVEPVADDPTGKKAVAIWKRQEFTAEEAERAYTPLTVNQEWGVIFNLPSGSGECTLHWADLTFGWEMAKLAKTIRAARSQGRRALTCF